MIGVLKFEDDLRTTTLVPCIAGDMSAADAGETLRYVASDPLGSWVSNIEHRARQVLLDAGYDPHRPGLLRGPLEDGSLLYDSHLILRHLGIFRSEIVGDPLAALRRAVRIERIANKHDFFVDHGDAIKRGRDFINGPKNKRKDALAREIIKALNNLGRKAGAGQVLAFVKKNEKFEVEDDGRIFWTSDSGRAKTTSFQAFRNRIPALRLRSQ
jgi:hypothetical protein